MLYPTKRKEHSCHVCTLPRPGRPELCHRRFRKRPVYQRIFSSFMRKRHPSPRVQENGYRYYDIRDASLVLECFRMKNMGLSVRQIEKGINDCTEQEVAEMLQQRENVLQSQLHEQQMHLQGLQNLRVASGCASRASGACASCRTCGTCPTPLARSSCRTAAFATSCPSGWTGCRWSPRHRSCGQ